MAVPAGQRSENRLEVLERAQKYAIHLIEITANTKNFPGRFAPIVTRMCNTAWEIAENIYAANKVYIGDGASQAAYKKREQLQKRAIAGCNLLKFELNMAAKAFHLDNEWLVKNGSEVEAIRALVIAWKGSDRNMA